MTFNINSPRHDETKEQWAKRIAREAKEKIKLNFEPHELPSFKIRETKTEERIRLLELELKQKDQLILKLSENIHRLLDLIKGDSK